MKSITGREFLNRCRRTACLLLPLVLSACQGIGASGDFQIWACGPDRHIFPDTQRVWSDGVWTVNERKITLASAVNETVSFQLVLRSGGSTVEGVRVEVPPPGDDKHTFAPGSVTRYRERYVPVQQWSGWFLRSDMQMPREREYPDPLIPLDAPQGGEPFALPPNQNVPIWVDIHVAPETPSGLYRTVVSVSAAGGIRQSLALELTVWPFALPAAPSMACLAAVDPKPLFLAHLKRDGKPHAPQSLSSVDPVFNEAKTLLDQTMRLLVDHRCSPFLKRFYPTLKSARPAVVDLDWDDFDRIVAGYLDGATFGQGPGVSAWPLPVDETFPAPPFFGGLYSPTYAGILRGYLRGCLSHFLEKNWVDRHFVWIPMPDDDPRAGYAAAKWFGGILQHCDERLNFLTTTISQDMGRFGWHGFEFTDVSAQVKIWAPQAQFYFPQQMDQERAVGKQTWLRPSVPPFSSSLSVEAPPWQAAALAWQAARLRAESIFLEHIDDWPADSQATVDAQTDRSRDWLIYPGSICGLNQPIPSIRLKQLRRGLTDMEYRALLAQHRVPQVAESVIANLIKVAGADAGGQNFAEGSDHAWIDNPDLWASGRRLMGLELARLSDTTEQAETQSVQKSIEWLQFFQQGENVFVDVAPPRVRMAQASSGEPEIEFPVTITNYTTRPISGSLRFADAPADTKGDLPVPAIPPFARRRSTITARYTGVGTEENGLKYEKIEFICPQAGLKIQAKARIALIGATPVRKPLVIDGDLSDWPKAPNNTAGSFLLAGRPDSSEVLEDIGKATQQTLAFVCRDTEYLYLAFHCLDDQPEQSSAKRSNFVEYDGLTPRGEDLVEIMLDPTNSGVSGTSNVYHIVIKPTGAEISEIGIATNPPTGSHKFWPADLRVGPISTMKDRWVMEVRLPLAAFGPNALSNPFWGFNVARFQARHHEYSSWSGARQHFYSPQSMGNLWLLSP